MKKINNKNNFVFFLALFAILFLLNTLYLPPVQSKWGIYEVFTTFPTGFFFLFAIVIIPTIEEFVFRYFIVKSDKLKIGLSVFLSVILPLLIKSPALLFSVTVFNVFCIVAILRYNKWRTVILVLQSSIVFAVLHAGNLSGSIYSLIIYVSLMFTAGIILSIIRIQRGILYSISFHILYNGFILLPAYFMLPDSVDLDNSSCRINVQKQRLNNFKAWGSTINTQGDTLEVQGVLFSTILVNFLQNSDSTIYNVRPLLAKYSGTVYFLNPTPKMVVEHFNLKMDSTVRKVQVLAISDIKNKTNFAYPEINIGEIKQGESVRRTSFEHLIQSLSNQFNVPIKLDVSEQNKTTIVHVKYGSKDLLDVLDEIAPQLPFTFKVSRISTDVTYYDVY